MSKTAKPKPKTKTTQAADTKFDVSKLLAATQRIGKMTGTDLISLSLKQRKLRVSGENAGHSFTVIMDYPSKDTWEFSIAKAVLDQTLKGRKELNMSVDGSRLQFTARSFSADFPTEPFAAGPELQKDSDGIIKITAEQQERLLSAMRMAYLTSTFSSDTLFCVDMDKKRSYIACLDSMNAAILKDEGVAVPLKFSLPSSSFKTLIDMAGDGDYHLSATGAALCAWSDEWEMTLPFIQAENEFTLEGARKMVAGLGASFARCRCEDLGNALQAANIVLDIGSDVNISVTPKLLKVSGDSSKGTVVEEITAKMLASETTDFKIDGASAICLLDLAPSEFIEIGVDRNVFFIRANDETTEATYITALRN